MKVIKAEPIYVHDFIELVQRFIELGVDEYDFGFKRNDAESTYFLWVRSQIAFLLMDGKKVIGVFAGISAPHFFDYSTFFFHESMWFVLPEYQGQGGGAMLYRAVHNECIKLGIKKIVMGHTYGFKPGSFEKLYKRMGFRKLETHYVKDL